MIEQYGLSIAIIGFVAAAGLLTWWILSHDRRDNN